MIISLAILFVVLVLILIFTFIFIKTRNPITNATIYYYDETVEPIENETIIHKIIYNMFPTDINNIYIIKTNKIVNLSKVTFYSRIFGTQLSDCNVYIILSLRYTAISAVPMTNAMIFQIKDSIIQVPYLQSFIRYHVFNFIVDKTVYKQTTMYKDVLSHATCNETLKSLLHPQSDRYPNSSIVVSENIDGIQLTTALNIIEQGYRTLKERLFKIYVIGFDKFIS